MKCTECSATKVLRVCSALLLVAFATVAKAHEAEVVLYPTISPVSVPSSPSVKYPIVSPSFGAYAANTLFGLSRGWRNVGGIILVTPTAFNTIGDPISNGSGEVTISVYDTWATKGKSWRGFTPSQGPFANERGTHFRAAVVITSHSPFTLADVITSVTYPGDPTVYSASLGGPEGKAAYQSFESNRLRGIRWGPNGKHIVYDVNRPGSYTTPINQLLFVGFGDLGYADADPKSKSDAEQFAEYLAEIGIGALPPPYTFTRTYRLRGVSSTVSFTVKPPRPGAGYPRTPHRIRPFRPFIDR